MENKTWFTSDLHFGHNKDFVYAVRGFNTIQEHDKRIIENINEKVAIEDNLFILGDLMLGDNEHGLDCIHQLKCEHIHVILGNHDSATREELYKTDGKNIETIKLTDIIKYQKYNFYLSHYPTITANYDDYQKSLKSILVNLFGHTHQKHIDYNNNPFMYNVGLDAHNNYPVSADEIVEYLQKKKVDMNNFIQSNTRMWNMNESYKPFI